jgi:hypothetical protein
VLPESVTSKFGMESELILAMTEVKPEKRPAACEILKSQYLKHWGIDSNYD